MITFYYDKTKALAGKLFCLGQEEKVLTEEEIKDQGKEKLYSNTVTYTGDTVLVGHPIVEGDTVRSATDKELIQLGLKELEDGEILDGDNIKTIDRPQPYDYAYEWQSPDWILNQDLLPDGIYYDGEKFVEVPIPDNFIKYHWKRPNWIDDTQDIDRVEKQYVEYLVLNNPLDWVKMEEQGVLEDYKTFMKENETYIENYNIEIVALSEIPHPSEKLGTFFNKNKTRIIDGMITKTVNLNGEHNLTFNPLSKKIQNRASVITMSNLNTRIAKLEGKASNTPITMKGLADRLAQVEATAKSWEIVTLSSSDSKNFLIPEKYRNGWNFAVISWSEAYGDGGGHVQVISSSDINSITVKGSNYNSSYNFKATKSGNNIVVNTTAGPYSTRLIVIFYK